MTESLPENAAMPRILSRLLCLMFFVTLVGFGLPEAADAGSRELKATGAVGETVDGYLGIADAAAGQGLAGEVDAVNAARRDAYNRAAADTGRPLSEVQAVAGARLRDKAKPGDWIQNAAGEWVRKR